MSEGKERGSSNISAAEEAEFREIFNLVDKDGSGSITRQELEDLMKTLKLSVGAHEIELMIAEIDKDNDGEIQFEEFVAVMSRKVKSSYTMNEVLNAFSVFASSPGYIKVSDLAKALTEYGGTQITPKQVNDLIGHLQVEGTGDEAVFKYDAYVAAMMNE
jgi:calmodulin